MLLEALVYDNRIFGLDPQLLFQVVFQAIAIFILFTAASYLLLDPVRKILNDRKERVMKDQREASQNKEEAVRMKDEYDGKLKEIDKVAEQILSDSRKKALQRENEIIAEAELEKKRVKDEVKQEMISIAALMSEKIVVASIDTEKQNALIEQTLEEMGENTWQN